MQVSIMIEGQDGLTWPRWRRIAEEVERLGFAGLFRSDHFTNASPPDKDSLECWVSLAWLASHTERIHFGPLVSPFSFRHPAMLARQAAAVDELSGGRLILGLGAGWQDREHTLFGLDLGDMTARMARFEEGMEVVTRLLQSDAPSTFEGRHFRLEEAVMLPRPHRPGGPPILVGGNGPRRTLALAARHAQMWNGNFLSPDDFHERCLRLDALLAEAGRDPGEVKRTLMTGTFFGRDAKEIERRLDRLRQMPALKDRGSQELIEILRARGAVVGTPEEIGDQLRAFEEAGCQEIMLQWLDLDDLDGLVALAGALA